MDKSVKRNSNNYFFPTELFEKAFLNIKNNPATFQPMTLEICPNQHTFEVTRSLVLSIFS
jgi:hypothetical protein